MDTQQNLRVRGALVGTEVVGNSLQLWFDSPTGDTSDSVICTMPCRSEAEAHEIENLHRSQWNLKPANRKPEITVDEEVTSDGDFW